MYDVLPTLGNMLGISSPYALGHDIFSTDENVVVFPDGNWLTDKMYYSQSKGEGKLLNQDDTVSVDYINKYSKIADEDISPKPLHHHGSASDPILPMKRF